MNDLGRCGAAFFLLLFGFGFGCAPEPEPSFFDDIASADPAMGMGSIAFDAPVGAVAEPLLDVVTHALFDADEDGVDNLVDVCPGSVLDTPDVGLQQGRFAETADWGTWESSVSTFQPASVLPRVFSMQDTAGCTCEQIGDQLAFGPSVNLYGCTAALIDRFLLLLDLGLIVPPPGCAADSDGDQVCDDEDQCPGFDDNADADGDGVCDAFDACPLGDDGIDMNANGTPDACDPPANGFGMRFDGNESHLLVAHSESLRLPPTGLTVEVWVFYDRINRCATMVEKDSGLAIPEYWLNKNSQPVDSFGWWVFDFPFVGYQVSTYNALSTGAWYHIAGVHDPVNGEIRTYVNGELRSSASAGAVVSTNIGDLLMGGDGQGGCGLNGVLDEVRISAIPRYDADFVPETYFFADAHTMGLWHFDEGSGTTAFDASGNGNDATLVGAVFTTEEP